MAHSPQAQVLSSTELKLELDLTICISGVRRFERHYHH